MTVAASTLIANTVTPTTVDQLWSLYYLFPNNWVSGVTIHQSFMTDVIKSQSDLEQRRALMLCPARIFEVELLIKGHKQIGYFRAWLMRATVSRFLFPVHTDRITPTSGGSNSIGYVSGATTDKRYFVGGRVAVVKFDQNRLPTYLNVDTISVVGATALTVTGGTNYNFIDGTYYLYPLIEGELLLEQSSAILTSHVLQATLSISESRGNFSLDTLQAIGSNPSGLTFNGFPLLNIEPDMQTNNFGLQRSGTYTQNGRGKVLQIFGSRGRALYDLNFVQLSRTKAMQLVRWFEAMGGRLLPFYLLSPLADWKAVSFDATHVTVESSLIGIDWVYFPAIGVLMTDGTYQLRTITGTSQSGSNWILTVAAWSVTPSLTTIKRLACAQLVRFDVDEMIEAWNTDGVMSSNLKLVELLAENSLTISNIKDFTQGYF